MRSSSVFAPRDKYSRLRGGSKRLGKVKSSRFDDGGPDDHASQLHQQVIRETVRAMDRTLRTKAYVKQVEDKVQAFSVAGEVKKVVDGLGTIGDGITDSVDWLGDIAQDVPARISDLSSNVSNIPGQIGGEINTVAGNVWNSYIVGSINTLVGWVQGITTVAVDQYARGKAILARVRNVIARTFNSAGAWANQVLIQGQLDPDRGLVGLPITDDDNPVERVGKFIVNFILWVLTLFDEGIVFILKGIFGGADMFLSRLLGDLSRQVIQIADTADRNRRGRSIAGTSVHAMAGIDHDNRQFASFVGDIRFDSTLDLLASARDNIMGLFRSIVGSLGNGLRNFISTATGALERANPFKDIDVFGATQINALIANEASDNPSNKVRLIQLSVLAGKVFMVAVRNIFVEIIVPSLLAVAEAVASVIKSIVVTGAKIIGKFAAPVGKLLLRVVTKPAQIGAWLHLTALNESHKQSLIRNGKLQPGQDPEENGFTLKGDKIRNYANVFGVKSDFWSEVFWIGTASIIGTGGLIIGVVGTRKVFGLVKGAS